MSEDIRKTTIMTGFSVYLELTRVNKKLNTAIRTNTMESKKPKFSPLSGYTFKVLLKNAKL